MKMARNLLFFSSILPFGFLQAAPTLLTKGLESFRFGAEFSKSMEVLRLQKNTSFVLGFQSKLHPAFRFDNKPQKMLDLGVIGGLRVGIPNYRSYLHSNLAVDFFNGPKHFNDLQKSLFSPRGFFQLGVTSDLISGALKIDHEVNCGLSLMLKVQNVYFKFIAERFESKNEGKGEVRNLQNPLFDLLSPFCGVHSFLKDHFRLGFALNKHFIPNFFFEVAFVPDDSGVELFKSGSFFRLEREVFEKSFDFDKPADSSVEAVDKGADSDSTVDSKVDEHSTPPDSDSEVEQVASQAPAVDAQAPAVDVEAPAVDASAESAPADSVPVAEQPEVVEAEQPEVDAQAPVAEQPAVDASAESAPADSVPVAEQPEVVEAEQPEVVEAEQPEVDAQAPVAEQPAVDASAESAPEVAQDGPTAPSSPAAALAKEKRRVSEEENRKNRSAYLEPYTANVHEERDCVAAEEDPELRKKYTAQIFKNQKEFSSNHHLNVTNDDMVTRFCYFFETIQEEDRTELSPKKLENLSVHRLKTIVVSQKILKEVSTEAAKTEQESGVEGFKNDLFDRKKNHLLPANFFESKPCPACVGERKNNHYIMELCQDCSSKEFVVTSVFKELFDKNLVDKLAEGDKDAENRLQFFVKNAIERKEKKYRDARKDSEPSMQPALTQTSTSSKLPTVHQSHGEKNLTEREDLHKKTNQDIEEEKRKEIEEREDEDRKKAVRRQSERAANRSRKDSEPSMQPALTQTSTSSKLPIVQQSHEKDDDKSFESFEQEIPDERQGSLMRTNKAVAHVESDLKRSDSMASAPVDSEGGWISQESKRKKNLGFPKASAVSLRTTSGASNASSTRTFQNKRNRNLNFPEKS